MLDLLKDIKYVKGVGPVKAEQLATLGVQNLLDMIEYYPRTYEDRSKIKKIIETIGDEEAAIEAIAVTNIIEIPAGKMKIYKLVVQDNSGSMNITWFNQTYIKTMIKKGKKYKFYGKITIKNNQREMSAPIFEEYEKTSNIGKIIPIYPSTYGLYQSTIRKIVENALKEVEGNIEEILPEHIKSKYYLIDKEQAIQEVHFPTDWNKLQLARERLVFEELFLLQMNLLNLKNKYKKEDGIRFDKNVDLSNIIKELPFKLTNAQIKVINEIEADMEKQNTMNRLVQGDVGSGKTIVSILASYKAVKSGTQVAMLAPTSILATQHLVNLQNILSQYDIKVELLVSGITKKQKEAVLERLKNGDIDVLVGTHAILEENVEFKNLGLVITDEQHRFGVKQRGTIENKGKNPDVLVMTATPIPRTLALILFGDLDISIIDELPPNRQKIDTFAVTKGMEERVNIFIEKEIKSGRQIYIVCPLVEENEEIDAKSVMEVVELYKKNILSEYKVEYLHGKMKAKDKEQIMNSFKNGEIDCLISTTVIEVGVDVPNATIMIVENAERFGLAQLHQLRGRVGRGKHKSYCILKYKGNSEIIKKRMKVMSDTNDGFVIAEKDLELRGTGEFFGTKQHGIPDFKIANIYEDMKILQNVQKSALEIIEKDPNLEKTENRLLNKVIKNTIII